jgi:hypothetical protein
MTCLSSAAEICPSLFLSNTYTRFIRYHHERGVMVTHFESLADLLLGIGIVHLPGHQSHELCKVDRVVPIRVNLEVPPFQHLYSLSSMLQPTSLIMSSSSAWVGF